jgi:hypothetical protein
MDDVGLLTWRVFSRFVGQTDEPPAAAAPSPPAVAQPELRPLPTAAE